MPPSSSSSWTRGSTSVCWHGSAWRTVVSAKAHLDRARRLGLRTISPVSQLIDQHAVIVEALAAGELAACADAMRAHLRLVLRDVERIRNDSPDLFATDRGRSARASPSGGDAGRHR